MSREQLLGVADIQEFSRALDQIEVDGDGLVELVFAFGEDGGQHYDYERAKIVIDKIFSLGLVDKLDLLSKTQKTPYFNFSMLVSSYALIKLGELKQKLTTQPVGVVDENENNVAELEPRVAFFIEQFNLLMEHYLPSLLIIKEEIEGCKNIFTQSIQELIAQKSTLNYYIILVKAVLIAGKMISEEPSSDNWYASRLMQTLRAVNQNSELKDMLENTLLD